MRSEDPEGSVTKTNSLGYEADPESPKWLHLLFQIRVCLGSGCTVTVVLRGEVGDLKQGALLLAAERWLRGYVELLGWSDLAQTIDEQFHVLRGSAVLGLPRLETSVRKHGGPFIPFDQLGFGGIQ